MREEGQNEIKEGPQNKYKYSTGPPKKNEHAKTISKFKTWLTVKRKKSKQIHELHYAMCSCEGRLTMLGNVESISLMGSTEYNNTGPRQVKQQNELCFCYGFTSQETLRQQVSQQTVGEDAKPKSWS